MKNPKKKKVTWINNASSQISYDNFKNGNQMTVPKLKAVGPAKLGSTKLSSSGVKMTSPKKTTSKPKPKSKVTGALGSETRRKQYDKLNWAYDHTIAKKPQAKGVSPLPKATGVSLKTTTTSTPKIIAPLKAATKRQVRVQKRATNKAARVQKRAARKNK
jgi:hypothetical protein